MKSCIEEKKNADNVAFNQEIEKLGIHLKILQQSVSRIAAVTESFGALQIENKIKSVIKASLGHITDNLRNGYESKKREMEELRGLVNDLHGPKVVEDFSSPVYSTTKSRAISTLPYFAPPGSSLDNVVEDDIIRKDESVDKSDEEDSETEVYLDEDSKTKHVQLFTLNFNVFVLFMLVFVFLFWLTWLIMMYHP